MALCAAGLKGEILKTDSCALHPLIHTILKFAHAQDDEKEKSGTKNSAFS